MQQLTGMTFTIANPAAVTRLTFEVD